MRKNLFIGITGALVFLIAFISVDTILNKNNNQKAATENTQDFIFKKEKQLLSRVYDLDSIVYKADEPDCFFSPFILGDLSEQGITLFIYKKDKLEWWTASDVPIPNTFDSSLFSKPVIVLKNGIYLCSVKYDLDIAIVGVALVKRVYETKNSQIKNYFTKGLNLPQGTEIMFQEESSSVFSQKGEFLFSLKLPEVILSDGDTVIILFFLFSFLIFFSILTLYSTVRVLFKKTSLWINIVFVIFIIIVRVTLYDLKIPSVFYPSELFKPSPYLDSFIMPSIGDAFFNMIFLLSICFCLIKTHSYSSYRPIRKYDFLVAIFFTVLNCVVVYLYLMFVESLVVGSDLYICLSNFFKFNFYSALALCMICLSSILLFFVFKGFASQICRYTRRPPICFLSTIIGLFFGGILWHFVFKFFIIGILFTIVLYILYFWFSFKNIKLRSVVSILSILLTFTAFTGFHILQLQSIKEKEDRKNLAEKLFVENDPIIEHFFEEFQTIINEDKVLQKMLILQEDGDSIREYLKQKRYIDFWDYYEVRTLSCFQFQKIPVQNADMEMSCADYFIQRAERDAVKTGTQGLFLMDNGFGGVIYCSDLLAVHNEKGNFSFYLYLEFAQRKFPMDKKFSKLLLKKNILESSDMQGYSFAKYADKSLIKNKGEYQYPIRLPYEADITESLESFKSNGYEHLVYNHPKMNTILILSKKISSFNDKLNIFSSVFILFSLTIFLFLFLNSIPFFFKSVKSNFKMRIQISIIVIVMGASIVFGAVSMYYINDITIEKNSDIFQQEVDNIVAKLEEDYKEYSELNDGLKDLNDKNKEESQDIYEGLVDQILKYFSVYHDDITIYDISGKMIASTSPEIYKAGLISSLMDPLAFKILQSNNQYKFSKIENFIGGNYLNTYADVKNGRNKTLAYVSIPYFYKDDYGSELTAFFMTYIDMYALIILILFGVLIFITNLITKPLLTIKKQVEKFKPGKKINWKSNDEIGGLVREYNRMIDKLEESAYLFAKMEKENSWKEMTRQVAHEIKTPLTPMKLNIQQLQKTWNDQVPNFGERLEKTTKVLIEQIDILSKIATTFMDFAKMPNSMSEKVDLINCINSVIDLYKEDSVLCFSLSLDDNIDSCKIIADKQQLMRVFGNLFKNAEQAILPGVKGELKISIEKLKKYYILRFEDNGVGIPDSRKHLIFHPHFTTKEDGTGLGLSIVKNIVESFNGSIDFRSVEGEGTTFTILFPIIGE